MNSFINGMPVRVSTMACTQKTSFEVVRVGILKRRRNWRVMRRETSTPTAYLFGPEWNRSLVVHPSIWDQMCSDPSLAHTIQRGL